MTSIDFYSNVEDKPIVILQVVQKALQQHRKVTIYAADKVQAQSLSESLWTTELASFLPNVIMDNMVTDDASIANVTPIMIQWQALEIMQDDLLINLQTEQPSFFSRFKQLVELVGVDEADKTQARKRYSYYRDRGYEIKHVDMFKKSI